MAERLGQGLRLVLHNDAALPPLATLLAQTPKGRARVQLVVELEDGAEAEIDLPGAWQISEIVKTQLRALPGGAVVQEL